MQTEQFTTTKNKGTLHIKKVQKKKASEFSLKGYEVMRIINHAGSFRNRCIIKTFALCGVRREELQNLRIEDINFKDMRIFVRVAKFGKERTVPCNEDLLTDLKYLLGGKQKGPLFESERGGMLSLEMLNEITKQAGKRAGIDNPDPRKKHINPHLFRHTWVRLLQKAKVPDRIIKEWGGWKNYSTFQDNYGSPDEDTKKEEFDKVADGLFNQDKKQ